MTHDAPQLLCDKRGNEAHHAPHASICQQLLTAKDLAGRLAIDLKKVYRMVESKEIPGLRVGQQWRFIWEDVLGAIKQRSEYGDQRP